MRSRLGSSPLLALSLLLACSSNRGAPAAPSDAPPTAASSTAALPEEAPPPPPPPPEGEDSEEPESEPPPIELRDAKRVVWLELAEYGIYLPDPDQAALVDTKAARFDKSSGTTVVGFCVTTSGATTEIQTVKAFPGDPAIDRIIREAVARWRFRPWLVDGAAVAVCSERTFKIKFH
ncbi:MAG: TonB family protein [Myxococcales bacterium]|nr:TonB family protein [Myxococcales bacterium]